MARHFAATLWSLCLLTSYTFRDAAAFLRPPPARTLPIQNSAMTCCSGRITDVARRPEARFTHKSPRQNGPLPDSPIHEASRGHAIRIALSSAVAGLAICAQRTAPGYALDPKRQFEEIMRIRRQEDADNLLGGGELASPEGGKTIEPVLTLIPIVK